MFENYLLVPEAIVAVVNSVDSSRPSPVTIEEVERFIEAKRADPRYLCPSEEGSQDSWVSRIDAAKVLKEMFSLLTQTRVTYQKTDHSVALANWVIEHKPDALKEIVGALVQLLDAKPAQQ